MRLACLSWQRQRREIATLMIDLLAAACADPTWCAQPFALSCVCVCVCV